MNNSFYLKNVVYLSKNIELIVEKGIIIKVGEDLSSHATNLPVIDGNNLILFPSFVDCHVHLREPGYEWKEDVQSGLNAALHGGFVRVACMANTNPVNDTAGVTKLILDMRYYRSNYLTPCKTGSNSFKKIFHLTLIFPSSNQEAGAWMHQHSAMRSVLGRP